MNKVFVILFVLLACLLPCTAQNAEAITDIINQPDTDWKSLTYLAYYMDEDNVFSDITPSESFSYFQSRGVIPQNVTEHSLVRLDEMSHFLFSAFTIPKTSLMYQVANTKRYAFRQMRHYGLMPSTAYPTEFISGRNFITFMGEFLEKFPDVQLK